MGWTWAVWFVQQMLEHLLPDDAGESTLRHLSPNPLWDDSPMVKWLYIDNFAALALSQAEADESLARVLRRLETAGVVAMAKPSVGNMLAAISQEILAVLLWLFENWPLGGVVARVLKSTAPSGMPCLCLDYDVTGFEGRVGRVWASVRREFRIAWRGSLWQRVMSRDRGIQLFMPQTRLSPGMGVAPYTIVKSVGSISERCRLKGPMRATSKPRSALDEEIGPSYLDLLNLTDCQALCLGTRTVFPEIPVELNAANNWRVLCARNAQIASWGSSAMQLFGLSEQFAEKADHEHVSTKSCQTAKSGGCASIKRSAINLVSRPGVHASCVVSVLLLMPVFVEPSRIFEWSSQCHAATP